MSDTSVTRPRGLKRGGDGGPIARRHGHTHGLTLDSLIAAEAVSAMGDVEVTIAAARPEEVRARRSDGDHSTLSTGCQFRLLPMGNC